MSRRSTGQGHRPEDRQAAGGPDQDARPGALPGGGNNYWPAAYSQKTKLLYIPSISACNLVTLDPSLSNKAGDWGRR
jgi:hypothetical protein